MFVAPVTARQRLIYGLIGYLHQQGFAEINLSEDEDLPHVFARNGSALTFGTAVVSEDFSNAEAQTRLRSLCQSAVLANGCVLVSANATDAIRTQTILNGLQTKANVLILTM